MQPSLPAINAVNSVYCEEKNNLIKLYDRRNQSVTVKAKAAAVQVINNNVNAIAPPNPYDIKPTQPPPKLGLNKVDDIALIYNVNKYQKPSGGDPNNNMNTIQVKDTLAYQGMRSTHYSPTMLPIIKVQDTNGINRIRVNAGTPEDTGNCSNLEHLISLPPAFPIHY
jgi:hypothetical protein